MDRGMKDACIVKKVMIKIEKELKYKERLVLTHIISPLSKLQPVLPVKETRRLQVLTTLGADIIDINKYYFLLIVIKIMVKFCVSTRIDFLTLLFEGIRIELFNLCRFKYKW